MALTPYPILGGLTLQGTDAFGVQWFTSKVKGWGGSPQGTLSPIQKPRQAGAWAGLSYAESKPIVLSGTAVAPSAAAATVALDRLTSAASLDALTLTVVEPSRSRWSTVRRDGPVADDWVSDNTFDWSVQLVALDPRKFGATLTAGPTGLPSSSGGLTVPYTVPYTIAATQTSGVLSLTNTGNAVGPVLMRIDGPGSAPIITHLGTGIALTFSTSAVLAAGEFWIIDMENRRVMAQGQSSRNGYITSRGWSGFDPGVNQWALTSPTPSAMTLTVTATEAFQ